MSELTVLALFILLLLLYTVWRMWRFWVRVRILADTPISRIRAAAQGYVELCGQIRLDGDKPLRAPLSGLPCAWFRFKVEERNSDRMASSLFSFSLDGDSEFDGRWTIINQGESEVPFWLEDHTGRCLVDGQGAEVLKLRQDVWYENTQGFRCGGSWHNEVTGVRHTGLLSGWGARYRCTEQRLFAGETIHAVGLFRSAQPLDHLPDARQEVSALLEGWKREPQMWSRFDVDKDGQLNAEEWEQLRLFAWEEVMRHRRTQSVQPQVQLLTDPEDSERPFLIAAFDKEHTLIGYYRRRMYFCLALALIWSWLLWFVLWL